MFKNRRGNIAFDGGDMEMGTMGGTARDPLLDEAPQGPPDFGEPQLDWKWSDKKVAYICKLDNHQESKDPEYKKLGWLRSSVLIQELGWMEGLMEGLKCGGSEEGIPGDQADMDRRAEAYGRNEFPKPHIKGIGELICENFADFINRVLLGAAVVSLIIGLGQHGFPKGMLEGTSIIIALCIIITVTSGNNYMSERRLAKLLEESDGKKMVWVIRGGKQKEIDVSQLLVGDVYKFAAGMSIPADSIMIEGQDVYTKEDELTGEPDSIEQCILTPQTAANKGTCVMIGRSACDKGKGRALVLAVGDNSVAGAISSTAGTGDDKTHLQEQLDTIASRIGNVGTAVAVLTFFAMIVRLALEGFEVLPAQCMNMFTCEVMETMRDPTDPDLAKLKLSFEWGSRLYTDLLDSIIIAITVIVVAIPEGLPLAVTISLSFSSAKMYKQNNLVRKLASSETMGGATHICSDKTGTLTKNEMTCMAVMTMAKVHLRNSGKRIPEGTGELIGDASDRKTPYLAMAETSKTEVAVAGIPDLPLHKDNVWTLLCDGVLMNSIGTESTELHDSDKMVPQNKNDKKSPKVREGWVLKGNPTEEGIMNFFIDALGHDVEGGTVVMKAGYQAADEIGKRAKEQYLDMVKFSSARKKASIVVQHKTGPRQGSDQEIRVYTKGAPDFLFEKCTNAITKDGTIEEFTDKTEVPENCKLEERFLKEEAYTFKRELFVQQQDDKAKHEAGQQELLDNDPNYVVVPYDKEKKVDGREQKTLAKFVGTHREVFEGTVKRFAQKAYRTILIAYRDMSLTEYDKLKDAHNNFEKEADRECLEEDLTAVGIFGLQDPLRDSIKDSIELCRTAGIKTIMCTGDNLETATAISLEAGILPADLADKEFSRMTGEDFRAKCGGLVVDDAANKEEAKKAKNDDDFKKPEAGGEEAKKEPTKPKKKRVKNMKMFRKIAENLRVLGRSSPEDKLLLVTGLQKMDFTVAVTGDGTNDAPALTRADVGFSMGITGTDVAKGASDIILLDDNFTSIITALRYGRNIYDNVRKFLQFQLSVNVVAMFIVFFGSAVLKSSPLTAVQMLWVNLIMDTFAALALATEGPEDGILERKPIKKSEPIVTPPMWRNVHGHACFQAILLVVVIFCGQGFLGFCHNYDLQCFSKGPDDACLRATKNADGNLKAAGSYNPFFALNHYYELGTKAYWEKINKMAKDKAAKGTGRAFSEDDFDQEAFAAFNCEYWAAQEANEAELKLRTATGEQLEDFCNAKTYTQAAFKTGWPEGKKWPHYPWDQSYEDGDHTPKLIHFTFVFQIFVFMQVFNQINARKLGESEYNIFGGIFGNWLFIAVTLVTFAIQMAMVQVGGRSVQSYPLTWRQNLICLAFGAIEILWGFFLKILPLSLFQCISIDDKPDPEGNARGTKSLLKSGSSRGTKSMSKGKQGKAGGGS